eukprot:s474_g1.t1
MREKEEHEKHRQELKERLRQDGGASFPVQTSSWGSERFLPGRATPDIIIWQDYIERFGCEPPEEKDGLQSVLAKSFGVVRS